MVNAGDPLAMANWYLALSTFDFDLTRLREMQEAQASEADSASRRTSTRVEAPAAAVPAVVPPSERPGAGGGEANLDIPRVQVTSATATATPASATCSSPTPAGAAWSTSRLGDRAQIVIDVEFRSDQPRHLIGFYMRDRLGTGRGRHQTWQERLHDCREVRQGDVLRYAFTLPIDLRPGFYSLLAQPVAYPSGHPAAGWTGSRTR